MKKLLYIVLFLGVGLSFGQILEPLVLKNPKRLKFQSGNLHDFGRVNQAAGDIKHVFKFVNGSKYTISILKDFKSKNDRANFILFHKILI